MREKLKEKVVDFSIAELDKRLTPEQKIIINTPLKNLDKRYLYLLSELEWRRFQDKTLLDLMRKSNSEDLNIKSFISVGDKIIGWFALRFGDLLCTFIDSVKMFAFDLDSMANYILIKDVNNIIKELLNTKVYRVRFTAIKENPANKIYDKFIKTFSSSEYKIHKQDLGDCFVYEIEKNLKECLIEESRHLVKINVYRNGNQWTFSTEGKSYVAICDEKGLVDLLRKLKAKDDKEEPRSFRSETYKQIAQEIIDGTDRTIYVWSTDLNSVWGKGSVIYKQEEKCMKKRIKERDEFMNGTSEYESDIKESYYPNTITIKEEFKIPGTNIVLEEGDKISIMESQLDLKYCAKQLEKMFRSYDYDDFDISIRGMELHFKVESSSGWLIIVLNSNGEWKIKVHDYDEDGWFTITNKGVGYEELLKGIAEDDEGEFAAGWGFGMDYKKYL